MNVGIMQPYFLPNIAHFSLIEKTEHWIIFDSVQFIRHGWIERNRVLKPNGGWQYISIPLVKHSRETLIKDVQIRTTENWESKIFSQLEHYKKKAPFYNETIQLLKECFNIQTNSISELNAHALKTICAYLDIQFHFEFYSKMDMEIPEAKHAGDWALQICKKINVKSYTNPISGQHLFDASEFNESNIKLQFLESIDSEYPQKGNEFESGLSIIDSLMFNPINDVQKLIKTYTIHEA